MSCDDTWFGDLATWNVFVCGMLLSKINATEREREGLHIFR